MMNRTPETSVQAFLAAARGGDVQQMAHYWGGPDGPAARTRKPAFWERRIEVIQKYLENDSASVATVGTVSGQPGQVLVTMRIYRAKCRTLVPFATGKWKDLWLVQNVDLSAAGNPARPCDDQGNPL
jgi:hypothetical protein